MKGRTFSNWATSMGARRKFSRGGQNHQHLKKLARFRRAVHKIDHFSARLRRKRKFLRFSRRFRLKYRVSRASAEGASENVRVFCRTAVCDVTFSNSRGASAPPPLLPLRAPMAMISQGVLDRVSCGPDYIPQRRCYYNKCLCRVIRSCRKQQRIIMIYIHPYLRLGTTSGVLGRQHKAFIKTQAQTLKPNA